MRLLYSSDSLLQSLLFAHKRHKYTESRHWGGFYVCAGGLYVRVRGAWHSNLTKIPLIYSVSCFNLGGLSSPKAPCGDGTVNTISYNFDACADVWPFLGFSATNLQYSGL